MEVKHTILSQTQEKQESYQLFFFLELNENKNTIKAVIRGKFVALCFCIKSFVRSQMNNLVIYLKAIAKQEQATPLKSRWKEIIVRAETDEPKMKKIQKINEIRCQFSGISNKTDKYLAKLTKRMEAN